MNMGKELSRPRQSCDQRETNIKSKGVSTPINDEKSEKISKSSKTQSIIDFVISISPCFIFIIPIIFILWVYLGSINANWI
jgi:hypothetical protein